ncbi:MAG: cysteine desulfurase [Actinobacteria bacterium]|nr:cysteine desulfurase [Actinomycetota bacterium]
MQRVYLDHAATTPMVAEAISALVDQSTKLGNPSSLHTSGREVRKDVEEAREAIAKFAECAPSEIIFTGSGTEANNAAIKGLFWSAREGNPKRRVIVTSPFEHHAVMDPIDWLAVHEGAEVVHVGVSSDGVVDLDDVKRIIEARAEEIALISIMHSNNEIGTVQPISEIVQIASEKQIAVHSDAVQSFGKVEFSFKNLGLTAATLSAHKIGGPLGIGILILKRGLEITPVLHGGGQERDIRSGTLNAPAIVSFAAAVKKVHSEFLERNNRVRHLKEKLKTTLNENVSDIRFNGRSENSLPGILNVTFPGAPGDALLLLLDAENISTSTGSACSAGVAQPSHVLLSLGLSERDAKSSLRFSLGHTSTDSDVAYLGSVIGKVVERARAAGLK